MSVLSEIKEPIRLTKKQNIIQAVKFTLFSLTAGIIQVISFTLLNEIAHLNYWVAYLIALTLSVLWNFTINRRFTFKSANNVPLAMLKVIGYYLVFTPLSTWWGTALTNIGWNEYIVLVGTMLINFVTEFLFWRIFVFGKSINTNDLGKKENERMKKEAPVIK
jgi:putative flippase GtrA